MCCPGPPPAPTLFDATAADGAEQLAASLLAELTPPWSRWFGLAPARPTEDRAAAEALEDAAATLQGHFDRSNFTVEMHQAFLDLVVAGTGLLLVEEAPLGEASALPLHRGAGAERGAGGRAGWPALHHLPPGAADRGAAAGPLPHAPTCPPRWPATRRTRPSTRCWKRSGRSAAPPATPRSWPIPPARCCWPRAASPKARRSPSAG